MEKIYHEDINQKTAGLAIVMTDKVDFRTERIIRDRDIM